MVNLRNLEKDRPEDRGHKNPPLHEQNKAYRGADAMNQHEIDEASKGAADAVRAALGGKMGRRFQKNLR